MHFADRSLTDTSCRMCNNNASQLHGFRLSKQNAESNERTIFKDRQTLRSGTRETLSMLEKGIWFNEVSRVLLGLKQNELLKLFFE